MKILAAHQPVYLPDLAFFYKMAKADVFVLADDLQYSTHGNINRARIKSAAGAQWLTVPVLTHGRQGQRIREVEIANAFHWRQRHLKTLTVSYKKAAFFEKYIDFFEELYAKSWHRLFDLNQAAIEYLREALEIRTPMKWSSEMDIEAKGTARIIEMAHRLGCDAYLAEQRYESVLDPEAFAAAGLILIFVDEATQPYHQLFGDFIPGLSVVDLLMNEGDMARRILLGG